MSMASINLEHCLDYIRDRLELWARYIDAEGGNLNGVPAYMRLVRSEPQSTPALPCTFDEYNQINQLIARLPEPLRVVVHKEHLGNGTQEMKAMQVRPPRKGISVRTYRGRLKLAYGELMRMGL